ncbi:MAG: response regulator, partial [Candidatus Hydrogenedentes bacterium]|nr:response regulator [Candidatus Hydrogenedentota bacterium]
MYSLVRAQKMDSISRLAGGVAHDFNNLLSGILGYASLMRTFVDETDPVRPYITTIVESAERGAALTKRLLEFAGHRSFELRPIDPNQLINDTAILAAQTAGSKIAIEADIDDLLPAIEADPGQIQQAVIDLCKNACEAMPDGGTLRIEARHTEVNSPIELFIGGRMPCGDYVRISVFDTGVGMDTQALEHAFEPFYTTKEPGCGSGLGLSSTLGIVRLHKGYIDIASEVGNGTRVDMYLPTTSKQVSSTSVIYKPQHNGAGTILVVDDEDTIRRMAADILSRVGYTVILARDGSEGVRAYSQHNGKIDAVVLDYKMPRMNGIETSYHIRRLDPQARILLATGCAERDTVDDFALDTIDDMLFKPFKHSELTGAIQKIMDKVAVDA